MSQNFIINPLSISYESIKGDLLNYITAKPEQDGWADYFATSAGTAIIELIAALGAFYIYHFIMGRRESYLSTCNNYSSSLGSAEDSGYSASRGVNSIVKLKIIPNTSAVLPKWTIFGTCKDVDFVLMDDVVLNDGEEVEIVGIIGNFLQESINVTTADIRQFNFINDSVTDTFRLMLNDKEVPTSTVLSDALNDYYITLSNIYGALDVMYLQNGDYKYASGDKLNLQFIARNNIKGSETIKSDYVLYYANTINDIEFVSDYTSLESIDSIKVKAPIFRELGSVIRARHDYSKYILTQYPGLLDANDHDIYPGLIEITALKDDHSYLTDEEIEEMNSKIESVKPGGVAKQIFAQPERVDKNISITITKMDTSYIDATIQTYIEDVIKTYCNKFEKSLNLYDIENAVDQFSGIKVSRIRFDSKTWEPNTYYSLFDVVSPTDPNKELTFILDQFCYNSGDIEPHWPDNLGDSVEDGSLIWTKVDESLTAFGTNIWEPNVRHYLYDYCLVEDSLYRVSGYVHKTGAIVPDWLNPDINEVVYDNDLIWAETTSINEIDTEWEANVNKNIGDIVKIKYESQDPLDVDKVITESKLFGVIGFRSKSGPEEPKWEETLDDLTKDRDIYWKTKDVDTSTITLNWNQYFNLTSSIKIN